MRTRSIASVALFSALALVLAACGGGGGTKKSEKKTPATPTTAPRIAPLTGLPDAGGQSLTRSALEVKIENADLPGVRPQAGLDAADIVYEEVVEGLITRFLVVYNSNLPDTAGPIRSVRATDANLVWPLGGVFAYSGGAQPNVDLIHTAPVNAVDESGAGDAMYRDNSRDAPHNLFGHPVGLMAKGGKPVPPPALFQYLRNGQVSPGDPVTSFHVGFSPGYDPTYTYDAGSKSWKRSYGFKPFNAADGQQIAPANVVVMFIQYDGGAGSPTAEGVTVGQGDAWVFTDGKVVKGTWQRSDKAKPIQYVAAGGAPIQLQPGPTWVELLPVGSAVDVSSPAPGPSSAPPTTTKKK